MKNYFTMAIILTFYLKSNQSINFFFVYTSKYLNVKVWVEIVLRVVLVLSSV